jgi:hypothetical protein
VGKRGHLLTLNFFNLSSGGGSTAQGLTDLDVVVEGRLTAATESALWALRDAIAAQLTEVLAPGTLADNSGRNYANMSLVTLEEQEERQIGRVFSIGYVATFRRVTGPV